MLSNDTSTATGVLTGPTQTIVLDFYFMANTDLVVTRTRAGVVTTLTLDSDYSIAGAGNESGGSITVTGQASGDVITIERTIDYKQISDYIPLTKLSATTIERDFDRCAMRDQQIVRRVKSLEDNPSTGIEEAPLDGTPYARQDGDWTPLSGGGDMLKAIYDTDNDGKVDTAEVADFATYATTAGSASTATTAGTISGSITMSQVSDAGDSATKDVGTTSGTVAAGDDGRIVAGGTALQPTGSGASLTGMTASQVGLGNVDNTSDANKPVSSATQTALNAKQTADADLTAIAALAGTSGFLTKTAADTWSLDTNTYLTTTAAASTYQPLDADLIAIAGLSGTAGLLRKTAADTWSLDTNVYLTGNETITLSGDATGSGTTAITVTLANSGVSAGSYGSATAVPAITVDAKGRVTAVTATSIQIAESQVTDLVTALSAKAPVDNPTFTTGITTPAANITGLTASRALVTDASKNIISSSVTSVELSKLAGIGTTTVKAQLDAKAALAGSSSQAFSTSTAASGSNTTIAASTAFVQSALGLLPFKNMIDNAGRFFTPSSQDSTAHVPVTQVFTGTLSITAATATLTCSASNIDTSKFQVGKLVGIGGASNYSNRIQANVASVSTSTIVLEGDDIVSLVDEAEGSTITLYSYPFEQPAGWTTTYGNAKNVGAMEVATGYGGTYPTYCVPSLTMLALLDFLSLSKTFGIGFNIMRSYATSATADHQLFYSTRAQAGLGAVGTRSWFARVRSGTVTLKAYGSTMLLSVDGAANYTSYNNGTAYTITDNNWHYYRTVTGQTSTANNIFTSVGAIVETALPWIVQGELPAGSRHTQFIV